jgi:hypothetical protein
LAFRASTGVGASQEMTIRTLHPDAASLANALPVVVHSGDEIGGVDIRMKVANTFRISGSVTSTLPAGPVLRQIASDFGAVGSVRPPRAEMALVPRDPFGLGDMILSIQATIKDDNTFEFRNVLPGAYEVVARLPVANGWGNGNPPGFALAPVAFGRMPVEVVDRSVENVNVVVHQGADLNGVLLIDGKPASAAVRISLRSDNLGDRESNTAVYEPILDAMASYTPPIGQDGAFTIPLVPEARYRFQIVPGAPQLQSESSRLTQPNGPARTEQSGLRLLPETSYVSDVRQAGISIYDNGFAVGASALAPIEVLINTDAGSIQGIVVETDQKPVPSSTIVLVPQAGRRQNPALYKTVRSDADGRFTLSPVPPGAYKLFASQSIPPGAYQNAEFISKYDERGTPVIVRSGQVSVANLDLLKP